MRTQALEYKPREQSLLNISYVVPRGSGYMMACRQTTVYPIFGGRDNKMKPEGSARL